MHRLIILGLGFGFAACGADAEGARDTRPSDASDGDGVADVGNDDGADEVEPEIEVFVPPSPGSFRWQLGAVTPADFYAYPWPSDLRTTATGAPDLAAFSIERARTSILGDAVNAVEAGPAGFSPLASAYFGLTVELDPESIAGNVLLVDVDRGERLAATPEWNASGGGYWPARTLAVHPDYQQPPPAGTRIAAILLNGLRSADGAPLVAPDAIAGALAGSGPEAESLATLLPALSGLGLERADLLAWTTWRSSDPMAELRQLAGWVHRQAPPATSERC